MRMIPRSRAGLYLVIPLVLAAALLAYFIMRTHRELEFARVCRTQVEAIQIVTAIHDYEIEYGVPPAAADNAGFIHVLTHDNPRGITYLSPSAHELNAKHEMVDAWGKAFSISINSLGETLVTSPSMQLHDIHWHPAIVTR